MISSIDVTGQDPIPLLFQSGYLTIKDYDECFSLYTLGFPNKEVEQGFLKFLLPFYTSTGRRSAFSAREFILDVNAGDAESFMKRLKAFFDSCDYRIAGDKELYFHNAMYLVFRLMGVYTLVEQAYSDGGPDIVIKTPGYIYIVEVKLDHTAAEAMQQIEDKDYAKAFALDGRKVVKIGVSFSSEKRSVTEWLIK